MAPEWTQIVDSDRSMGSTETAKESLKKLDIFAMGIILSDLICNPCTQMEQMRIDRTVQDRKPSLPPGYKLEGTTEGELLLALVSPDISERPSVE